MKLKEEWRQRIQIWTEELEKQWYQPLEPVIFEGHFTRDHLRCEEAKNRDFGPMSPGSSWGEKWEYGWFKSVVQIPAEGEGERIYLKPGIGGEMLLWVNGKLTGAKDIGRDGITLTRSARAGETFEILAESYAGHGPRLEHAGPNPPERIAVPEPDRHQVVVGESTFGIWNEDAYALSMDAETLKQLYEALDKKSLRAQKIREGLEEFTKIADFELPVAERNRSFQAAREVLRPLLECVNGSTAPVYTIFGQSHLDLAWKWPWEETKRKCARTLSTQLTLMEEYPEYKYLLCEPPIMEAVKNYYPELYQRVKEKVQQGQLMPEGGVWVESDTNIPAGESLIRQCLWGKAWFRNEYGYDTKMVWMPDCFGFSAQLPQIFIGTGMKYFATQKLARALPGYEVFPYNLFMWEGIDGTRILTHFFKKNNSRYNPKLLLERWQEDRVQEEGIDTFFFPFGFGDGGGGPTRDMLESVSRTKDLEGAPRTVMQSPIAFFEELEQKGGTKNRYVGELYFPWHRGTYTAQAKTKQNNRKAEIALRDAEFWGSIAGCHGLQEQLKGLWEKLLFNQFHDILPGASITRVHEEAERDLTLVRTEADRISGEAIRGMAAGGASTASAGITLFNSLSWERQEIIPLPEGATCDSPVQRTESGSYTLAKVPPCGYTTILVKEASEHVAESARHPGVWIEKTNGIITMENQYLSIRINEYGAITSIYDKAAEYEFAAGLCNELVMYKDINVAYDAWEISSFYEDFPVELVPAARIEVVTEGALFGEIRISRQLHLSEMTQEIRLSAHSRRVDFKTRIYWQETHKLLKVAFPVHIHTAEAIEEIQFGYCKRPTHRSRRYDADRYEVCNHKYTALTEGKYGFAVLNDCKYGVSTNENRIELTLLKAPLIPDMYADKGMQEFTYSFYAWQGSFEESDVVREAYQLNIPVRAVLGTAAERSVLDLSEKNIILETVKPAEDGSGDMILRFYEALRSHTRCTVKIDLPVDRIYETTMQECVDQETRELAIRTLAQGEAEVLLSFRPFEIKTLRVSLKGERPCDDNIPV